MPWLWHACPLARRANIRSDNNLSNPRVGYLYWVKNGERREGNQAIPLLLYMLCKGCNPRVLNSPERELVLLYYTFPSQKSKQKPKMTTRVAF